MSEYHLPEWAENIPEGWRNEFPSNDIYACVYNTESARCIRISLGLTQKDLALCLGLKPQYINSVEKGARAVSSRMLQALLYLGKQQRLVADIVKKKRQHGRQGAWLLQATGRRRRGGVCSCKMACSGRWTSVNRAREAVGALRRTKQQPSGLARQEHIIDKSHHYA